jgi:hypothetical protein
MYASKMLEQAIQNSDDYYVFLANLDAFVLEARSVTLVVEAEYKSVIGFEEWYRTKQQGMNEGPDFGFFNNLRVNTAHVRPFNASSKYTTSFPGGLTISGGKKVNIPLGRMDDRGIMVIDNKTHVTIDGEPAENIKRTTTRNYFFTDRPEEDAVNLCRTHLGKLQELVTECDSKFKILQSF